MAWYEDAIFYHIYPLGLSGAPKQNPYSKCVPRLRALMPWIDHIRRIGCNALYIGPLFESVGHGYETTDYKKLDSRLGTNEDLTEFVRACHQQGIRVILDGVFNHTGRDFFAFQDLKQNRENSPYRDWYCHVNFGGNNSFCDGFSYENWGGYDLLVKLNQRNPAVKDYICDVIRFWVSEFNIDGIRLDAADVLDHEYMKALRGVANEVKEDFWLMGEVIHGDYSRWVNGEMLHSVTNYVLHKALYSAHNDHNYFEVAHTIKYVNNQLGDCRMLYSFADNHDVERIATKLRNKAHLTPLYILLYTLPGIPSVYYGSEFAIEGKKERHSDDSLRPMLHYDDFATFVKEKSFTQMVARLGRIRQSTPAFAYGSYRELHLQTGIYAYARELNGTICVVAVNNTDHDAEISVTVGNASEYEGALFGGKVPARDGKITVVVPANSGEIWLPSDVGGEIAEPLPRESVAVEIEKKEEQRITEARTDEPKITAPQEVLLSECPVTADMSETPAVNKSYEEMTVAELQEAILNCMRKNGPVTEYMLGTVRENTHHGSLLNWVRSFRQ